MQELAKSHGGKCLSDAYIRSDVKLLWQCKEKHKWEATPDNIRAGKWCPICGRKRASKKRLLSNNALTKVAAKLGGKCLSKEYRGSQKKYLWECSKGHQWEATHNNVLRGYWCPYCAGKKQTIEDLKKIAEERNGRLISTEFKGLRHKYEWQCKVNHKWLASADSVKRGSWCPICKGSLGERITRYYLEKMTGKKFPTLYPEWLISESGSRLELDGYAKSINIAFEHQGVQHTERINYFQRDHKDFIKQLKHDSIKRTLCKKHGIYLIEVPQIDQRSNLEEIYEFLKQELSEAGIKNVTEKKKIKLNLKTIYSPDFLTKLELTIKDRNGQLLTTNIVNHKQKIRLRCEKGHIWETTIPIINNGSWCPTCSGVPSLTIKDCKSTAKERGGECLSEDYVDGKTKMLWRCSKGHEWETTYSNIRVGKWCPVCSKKRANQKMRKYTIDDMRAFAESKGGACLSNQYKNGHIKLRWRCSEGHEWENTWSNIKRGQWCRKCSLTNRHKK